MAISASCPSCQAQIKVPDGMAGKDMQCPRCGQMFTVSPNAPLSDSVTPARTASRPQPTPAEYEAPLPVIPVAASHDAPGFRCPYCQSRSLPLVRNQISTGGWVMFAVLLFFCFPLFFIGLLMTEPVRFCSSCGIRLG